MYSCWIWFLNPFGNFLNQNNFQQWILGCQFICTVQERSADWSIELLLKKYHLRCSYDYPDQFLKGTGISASDLTGDHNIFVLKIFLDSWLDVTTHGWRILSFAEIDLGKVELLNWLGRSKCFLMCEGEIKRVSVIIYVPKP